MICGCDCHYDAVGYTARAQDDPCGRCATAHKLLIRLRSDPRNDPDDAYKAFMSMPWSEWAGLIRSLLDGGVLTPAEQEGFRRALDDRKMA